MGFHNVTLNPNFIGYGSAVGPGHRTYVHDAQNAIEASRKKYWSQPRRQLDITNLSGANDVRELFEFVLCRRGSAHSFLVKDPLDFTTHVDGTSAATMTDTVIGTGDGTRTEFTFRKLYEAGTAFEIPRVIRKPVPGTVKVAVAGVLQTENLHYTVDHQIGRVSFVTGPTLAASITAGCEFRLQCRFAKSVDDLLGLAYEAFRDASYSIGVEEDMVPFIIGEYPVSGTDLSTFGGGTLVAAPKAAPDPHYLTFQHGRFVHFYAHTSGFTVRLPDINTVHPGYGPQSMFGYTPKIIGPGGPYFVMYNDGVGDITVQQRIGGAWVVIQTAQVARVQEVMEIFVDEDGEWRGR